MFWYYLYTRNVPVSINIRKLQYLGPEVHFSQLSIEHCHAPVVSMEIVVINYTPSVISIFSITVDISHGLDPLQNVIHMTGMFRKHLGIVWTFSIRSLWVKVYKNANLWHEVTLFLKPSTAYLYIYQKKIKSRLSLWFETWSQLFCKTYSYMQTISV